jgi:hypothetical protein
MKFWMLTLCALGVLMPTMACAEMTLPVDPDSLIATLPKTVVTKQPIFIEGARSDSLQVFTWDGAKLYLNGFQIYPELKRAERRPASRPTNEPPVPRATVGDDGTPAAPKELTAQHIAGNFLAPLLKALERGRIVFVGRGYYASEPMAEEALRQINDVNRLQRTDVAGPVKNPRILEDVLAANPR